MKYLVHFCFILLLIPVMFGCKDAGQEAQQAFDEGTQFLAQQKWNEAGERFLHSLALQDEKNSSPLLALTYNNISKVYWNQDYNSKAVAYALKGLRCANELGVDSLKLKLTNRVASSYYLAENHDTAITYFKDLVSMAIKCGDSAMVVNAFNNIGAVLISQQKFEDALKEFDKAQTYSSNPQKDGYTYHYNRSRCFSFLGRWEECEKEIRLCMALADSGEVEAIQKLYARLFRCKMAQKQFEQACVFADSSDKLRDSLLVLKQREELKSITEQHQQEKFDMEQRLQRIHWMLVVLCIVALAIGVIAYVLHRSKRRALKLQQRLESLKLQIVRESERRENVSDSAESVTDKNLESLQMEQFKVARDLYRMRPDFSKLRQLKYRTDKNYLTDEQRMPLIDSVVEVFLDSMQGLRNAYPELSTDECIYAVLVYLGCSNATISILTKTTEATLRKRRSRFHQKTNDQIFAYLMKA